MAYTSDIYRQDTAIEQQLQQLREKEHSILRDRLLTALVRPPIPNDGSRAHRKTSLANLREIRGTKGGGDNVAGYK